MWLKNRFFNIALKYGIINFALNGAIAQETLILLIVRFLL